jgi:hypothetical protein
VTGRIEVDAAFHPTVPRTEYGPLSLATTAWGNQFKFDVFEAAPEQTAKHL